VGDTFSDTFSKLRHRTADLRIHREFDANLLEKLPSESIEKAWIHPLAVGLDDGQLVTSDDLLELANREFSLPTSKPAMEEDEGMLDDRVDVVPLRDIHKKISTLLENAHVLPKEPLSVLLSKVFEEPLVKDYIEGEVRKWEKEGISLDDVHWNAFFS
jgi:hypothetical protein